MVGADGRAKAYRPLAEPARRAAREAGIAAYEAGRFWHAHELLEPAWMGSPDPAERDLDQGLIKLAAAYVHAERGNAAGMRKNLRGAQRLLAAVCGEHGDTGRRAAEGARVDATLLLARVTEALAHVEDVVPLERLPRAQEASPAPAGGPGLLERVPPPSIPRIDSRAES